MDPSPRQKNALSLGWYGKALAVFALVFAIILVFSAGEIPPAPIYERPTESTEDPLIPIETRQPLVMEFIAPGPDIKAIHVQYLFTDPEGDFELTIDNVTRKKRLATAALGFGTQEFVRFEPGNAAGDRIQLTFMIYESKKRRIPEIQQGVKRAKDPPSYPIVIAQGGRTLTDAEIGESRTFPLINIRYEFSLSWVCLIWPAIMLGFVGLVVFPFSTRQVRGSLIVLAFVVSVTSMMLWFLTYEFRSIFDDPDDYQLYGEQLHAWLVAETPEARAEAAAWIRDYPHAHAPLTSSVIALLKLLHFPPTCAYIFWCALCSFGSCLLLHWFLVCRMGLSVRGAMLIAALFATHVLFLKSFARPGTDAVGIFLTFAFVCASYERFRRPFTWKMEIGMAVLFLALALCRPAGVGYAAFFMTVFWLIDICMGKPSLETIIGRPIIYALPAISTVGLLFLAFNWSHTLELNFEKQSIFAHDCSWEKFWPSAIGIGYIFVPFLFAVRKSDLARPTFLIGSCWIVFYLGLLIWVQAPLISRLILPVLPALFLLLAPAMDRFFQRAPVAATGIAAVLCCFSICFSLWQLSLPLPPEVEVTRFVHF